MTPKGFDAVIAEIERRQDGEGYWLRVNVAGEPRPVRGAYRRVAPYVIALEGDFLDDGQVVQYLAIEHIVGVMIDDI